MTDNIRTLFLDIETAPAKAYVWRMFDNNISLDMMQEYDGVLSWASKWAGEDYTDFSSVHMTNKKSMLQEVWRRLDEADEVVGFNSNSFDLRWLNAEFAVVGMGPPSPYKKIDLMRTVKRDMKFISNKLAYLSERFNVGEKLPHEGFDLWAKCMQGDEEAWATMEAYNRQDVVLTEELYDKLRPWITTGVNRSAVSLGHVCPSCGSVHLQSRGTARTTTMTYRRYHCQGCGAWSRARVADKHDRSEVLVLAR